MEKNLYLAEIVWTNQMFQNFTIGGCPHVTPFQQPSTTITYRLVRANDREEAARKVHESIESDNTSMASPSFQIIIRDTIE